MNDPPRLRHGHDALIAGLLDAGRREEPSPELVARVLRSAALGVGAGLMATHAGAASSLAAGGSASGATTAGAAAGGGAASIGAAGAGAAAGGGAASIGAASAAGAAGAGAAAGGGAASIGAASAGAAGAGAASAGVAGAGLIKTGLAGVTLAKWVGTGIVGLSLATGVPKVLHWGEQRPSAPSTPRAAEPLAASASEHAMRPAHRSEPVALPDAPAPVAAVAAVAAAPDAPAPVAPEALATATRRAHAPVTAPRRSRTSAGSIAGTSAHTLGVELQMVDSARAALQRGDAAQALERLRSYEHDAPERQLRLEVAMLRMEAHAALGDMPRARALAAAIVAQPVSPLHAARAREILNSAEADR